MTPVPAPQEDERERRDDSHRSPSEIIKDITQVRLPSPTGGMRA